MESDRRLKKVCPQCDTTVHARRAVCVHASGYPHAWFHAAEGLHFSLVFVKILWPKYCICCSGFHDMCNLNSISYQSCFVMRVHKIH